MAAETFLCPGTVSNQPRQAKFFFTTLLLLKLNYFLMSWGGEQSEKGESQNKNYFQNPVSNEIEVLSHVQRW